MKRFMIAITIFSLLIITTCTVLANKDVAGFRNDLSHTGVYDSDGLAMFQGLNWRFATEGPIVASPTIYKDMIYFGSDDTYFYAIDLATGEEKWKFKTDGSIKATPAITRDLAFISSQDGQLYALNANTGDLKWSYDSGANDELIDDWDYWQASPVIKDTTVYFGGWNGKIFALNIFTGGVLQEFSVSPTHCTPTIANDKLYVGTMENGIEAYDLSTGKNIWSTETAFPVFASTLVYQDGLVYVGVRDAACLRAFDAETGEEVWRFISPAGSWIQSSPAIYDGVLYVGSSDDFKVYAINAKTGEKLWESLVVDAVHSSPAYANGILHFGTSDNYGGGQDEGYLYALDAETGNELWKLEITGMIHSSMIMYEEKLFFGCTNGALYSLY